MDLEGIMLREISQTEKDKYCMISLICGILKKYSKLVNITKKKQTHSYREQTSGYHLWHLGEMAVGKRKQEEQHRGSGVRGTSY